jgi:hypothetical protein
MKKVILLGFAICCLQLESEANTVEYKSAETHISASTTKSTYKRRRKKDFYGVCSVKKTAAVPNIKAITS